MALFLKNFDQYLATGLIKKGLDYYQKQAVRELESVGENAWIAFVDGTETYEVEVALNNKLTITEHSCDCPVDDPVCKHQVAVFYVLREELALVKSVETGAKAAKTSAKKKTDVFDSVLDGLSEQDLREFVRRYAQKHKDFKSDLLIQFSDRSSEMNKAHYVQMLKQVQRSSADRSGFIDYYNARQYTRQVDALMKQARTMLSSRNFRGMMAIAEAVLEQVSVAVSAMDDSDGGASSNLTDALDMLKQSYWQTGAPDLKRDIFDYLMGQAQEPRYQGYGTDDEILDLLAELCEYPEQEEAYEQLLDRLQANLPEKKKDIFFTFGLGRETDDDWNWNEQRLIERRMKLYETRGRQAEARALLEANSHLRPLRERLLGLLITEKHFDRAKQLVYEKLAALQPLPPAKGKRQQPVDWRLSRQQATWYEWLLKIAQIENDTDHIREYAQWLFRQSGYGDLGYYRLLKKTYPPDEQVNIASQFITECEQDKNPLKAVLGNYVNGPILADNLAALYVEEHQWEELMALVEQKGNLDDVMKYDRFLSDCFSERLLNTYWKTVNKYAEDNVDTGAYATVGDVLRRMKQLTGGLELVAETVADYRTRFARRRKMMEVLGKV